MPAEFELYVNEITKSYIKKGLSEKRAKNLAYATAQKMYYKKHGRYINTQAHR